jgi:hypothetical protein
MWLFEFVVGEWICWCNTEAKAKCGPDSEISHMEDIHNLYFSFNLDILDAFFLCLNKNGWKIKIPIPFFGIYVHFVPSKYAKFPNLDPFRTLIQINL